MSNHRFGLNNTLRRIEIVGGHAEINSQPNQGCYISLEFPRISMTINSSSIRIVLVDDHVIVREGIRTVINKEEDLIVVGEASNMQETLNIVEQTKPDVIVMDVSLGSNQPDGIEVIRKLRKEGFLQSIIILSSYDIAHYQIAIKDLDIQDYLIKGEDTQKLLLAIRSGSS